MASRADVESRLRGYAQEYDREFPSTTRVEGRIMARISIAPRVLGAARVMRPRWSLAGVLVRQLAMVCVLLIAVGVLVLGVSKLRAVQRHNVPSVGAPGKLDVYFSALHFTFRGRGLDRGEQVIAVTCGSDRPLPDHQRRAHVAAPVDVGRAGTGAGPLQRRRQGGPRRG